MRVQQFSSVWVSFDESYGVWVSAGCAVLLVGAYSEQRPAWVAAGLAESWGFRGLGVCTPARLHLGVPRLSWTYMGESWSSIQGAWRFRTCEAGKPARARQGCQLGCLFTEKSL